METGIFTAKSKTGIFTAKSEVSIFTAKSKILTAKSNKSKKVVKKGLRSKTFFDREPELRFDFFSIFTAKSKKSNKEVKKRASE